MTDSLILSLRRKVPKAKTLDEMFAICTKLDELGDWKRSAELSRAWLRNKGGVNVVRGTFPKTGMPKPMDSVILRARMTVGREKAANAAGLHNKHRKDAVKRIEARLRDALADPAKLAAYELTINQGRTVGDPDWLFAVMWNGEPRLLTYLEIHGEPTKDDLCGYYRITPTEDT